MQIHLIADEKSVVLAGEIQKFLEPFFKNSGVEFLVGDKVYKHQNHWFWDEIFNVTHSFLANKQEEHMALFLVNGSNEANWFAAQSPHSSRMAFVHTEAEENYGFSTFHRVAYHVLAVLTRSLFYGNLTDAFKHYHEKTIGCMNDFTSNKSEVVTKVRSGYICQDCLNDMKNAANAHPMAIPFLKAVIGAFAEIRQQVNHIDLTALIGGEESIELHVTQGHNFSVKIGRKEIALEFGEGWDKALYLYLLDHPEGLIIKDLSRDVKLRTKVAKYYNKFCGTTTEFEALELLNRWQASGSIGDIFSSYFSKLRDKVDIALAGHPEIIKKLSIHRVRNKAKQLDLSGIKVDRFDKKDQIPMDKVA